MHQTNHKMSPPNVSPSIVYAPGSPMEDILRTCQRVASTDVTVLLTGETGTGKEVIARALHDMSSEVSGRRGAFVPVNCGAIPETLLEAELFGHARGAFTGAHAARKGRVAMAEGGTLFLDEIGELALGPQVKLLRLLQERTYEPVGESRTVRANFRLIAATNRDLAAEVRAGRFRQDLYYRLFVCPLELPPLRDRRMDLPELARHFWRRTGDARELSHAVIQKLMAYPWPGNIRELENLIERLSVCTPGPRVGECDLPERYRSQAAPRDPCARVGGSPLTILDDDEDWRFDFTDPSFTPPAPAQAPRPPAPYAPAPAAPARAVVPLRAVPDPVEPKPPRPVAAEAPLDSFQARVQELADKGGIDLPSLLKKLEWSYIDAALHRSGGNKQAAAKLLGLRRTTLVEKLRRRMARPAQAVG